MELMDMMTEAAPMLAETGAQTFRLARIMVGDNSGDFLLGVTHLSMPEIEMTCDAIGASRVASKIFVSPEENLRIITNVQGAAT